MRRRIPRKKVCGGKNATGFGEHPRCCCVAAQWTGGVGGVFHRESCPGGHGEREPGQSAQEHRLPDPEWADRDRLHPAGRANGALPARPGPHHALRAAVGRPGRQACGPAPPCGPDIRNPGSLCPLGVEREGGDRGGTGGQPPPSEAQRCDRHPLRPVRKAHRCAY